MNKQAFPISRRTLSRLRRTIGLFLTSAVGGRARLLLFALFGLMLCINGMNVVNSFIGRYFMSAIEKQDMAGFVRFAWLFLAVFAGSTLVGVLFRFTEEHLGLLWRGYLTQRVTGIYIDRRLYLRNEGGDVISNPDQRITEDIKQLTTVTLSFVLMIVNGTLTAVSFSSVLWSLSPKLCLVAVLYALVGSTFTIWLGRPLVSLSYRQADFEADFRSELIRTREEGAKIIETNREVEVKQQLVARINSLVSNIRHVIAVNRNLNFFTSGYNHLIQLLPVVLVAPVFILGRVEFGVIAQSAMAFSALLGAFSLIITQFQAISSYASVMARLSEFVEHAEKYADKPKSPDADAPG